MPSSRECTHKNPGIELPGGGRLGATMCPQPGRTTVCAGENAGVIRINRARLAELTDFP
jgi:hypothetical protein